MVRRTVSFVALAFVCASAGCGSSGLDAEGEDETGVATRQRVQLAAPTAFASLMRHSIHSRENPELCFTAGGESYEPLASVTLATCDGGKNQQFYRINDQLRVFDDKCVQAKGGEDADGTAIVVGECADKTSFDFVANMFRLSGSPRCVDVTDGAFDHGTNLQLWTCTEHTPNQAFGIRLLDLSSKSAPAPAPAPAPNPVVPTPAPPKAEPSKDDKAAANKPAVKPAEGSDKASVDKTPEVPAKPEQGKDNKPPAKPEQGKDNKPPAKPSDKPASEPSKPSAKPSTPAENKSGSNTFGPTPSGVLVAPYFYDWGSPTGFAKTLVDVRAKAGLKAATIAFGLSGGGCKVAGFGDIGADIQAFRKQQGQVILSFGGAAGTYLQATCQNSANLAKAILSEMTKYGTHFIDFDIEGSDKGVNRVTDPASNNALMAALVEVQKQDGQASISFTLAADDNNGLNGDGVKLLQLAASKGVKVARVNVMAMDYGHKPAAGKTTADMAIATAEKTAAQMAKIWPKASQAEIFHAIGITPMIGQNDGNQDAPFLPTDAAKVAAYAKQKGIGLLAYWAMQRDLAAKGDYNDHSNNQQSDYQYFKAFSTAQ